MKYHIEIRQLPLIGELASQYKWKPIIDEDGNPVEYSQVTAERRCDAVNSVSYEYQWRATLVS